MASDAAGSRGDLYDSTMTVPSDSENYSANNEMSSSPPSTSSSPMILYQPPTLWGILRGAAINLFLPFVNGLMLGFGELFAHEAAFRLGWSNTKVRYKSKQIDNSPAPIADYLFVLDFPDVPSVTSCGPRSGHSRAPLRAKTGNLRSWYQRHSVPGVNSGWLFYNPVQTHRILLKKKRRPAWPRKTNQYMFD